MKLYYDDGNQRYVTLMEEEDDAQVYVEYGVDPETHILVKGDGPMEAIDRSTFEREYFEIPRPD